MIPTLTTERLTMRAPDARDVEPFVTFMQSQRSEYVGGLLTRELAWRELAKEIGHWTLKGFGRWTVTRTGDDTAIGCIGLWEPDGWPEAEIGWDLFEGFEGHGYATEAAVAARNYAYETLGWTTAISLIDPANTASRAVAARLGCTQDGTFTHARFGPVDVFRHPSPEAL